MSCKAITWVSTLECQIGIGVFDDGHGKVTIRAAKINGYSEKEDTAHVEQWGGRLPIDEIERLLHAAKEK